MIQELIEQIDFNGVAVNVISCVEEEEIAELVYEQNKEAIYKESNIKTKGDYIAGLYDDEDVLNEVAKYCASARDLYDRTMDAYFRCDLKLANQALRKVDELRKDGLNLEERLIQRLPQVVRNVADKKGDAERMVIALKSYMYLRSIIWNLAQTGKSCSTIAEVAINRFLEQSSEICSFEKLPAS